MPGASRVDTNLGSQMKRHEGYFEIISYVKPWAGRARARPESTSLAVLSTGLARTVG